MRKVLKVRYSHDMYLTFEGTDMQRVSVYARTGRARKEAFLEILKKFDEGYELDIQFSLEAMFRKLFSDETEALDGKIRSKESLPNWVRYEFSPSPEYSPEEIKENRTRLGLSQEQLGQIVLQSASVVCYWERGIKKPNKHQMRIMQLIFSDPYVLLDANILSPRYSISERTDRKAREEDSKVDQCSNMTRRKKKFKIWDED